MFGILAVFSKLNEFQYALKARPPCDSDDVWAGMFRSLFDSVPFLRTPSQTRAHTTSNRKVLAFVSGFAQEGISGVGVPGQLEPASVPEVKKIEIFVLLQ